MIEDNKLNNFSGASQKRYKSCKITTFSSANSLWLDLGWVLRINSSISNDSIQHVICLHTVNVKQFYLTQRKDPIRCYYSGVEWIWERWQWRGTLHFPKLQHDWSILIRFFNVISGHLLGEGILKPQPTRQINSNSFKDEITNKWSIVNKIICVT